MPDSPDYPGARQYARDIKREFPQLSDSQAYRMACIAIRPDRNGHAQFVGFDATDRPVYESEEYGSTRRNVHTRSGGIAEVKYPVRRAVLPEPRPATGRR